LAAAEVLRGADLVKIDVEGQEFAILSAASDVLLRERPMIFLEILDESAALTTLVSEWVERSAYGLFFSDASGRIRRVPDGEIAVARLSSAVGAAYDNFMLLDEERHAWFLAAPGDDDASPGSGAE